MQKTKKVLIVSFHYLPEVMAASYRMHAWAKYLPRYGWEPIILTKTRDKIDAQYLTIESNKVSKEFDKAAGCIVYRMAYRQKCKGLWDLRSRYTNLSSPSMVDVFVRKFLNFVIGNFFMFPDERYDWFPDAVQAGQAIMKNHDIHAILATGAPWTVFLVARKLGRAAGIPWIADYRDPWSQPTTIGIQKQYIIRELANRILEKKLMQTASALIQISELLTKDLGKTLRRNVYLIPNGYDPENFSNGYKLCPSRKKFTISFIGTLHNNTNTDIFMEGFNRFVERTNITPEKCQVFFIGELNGYRRVKETYTGFSKIKNYFKFEPSVSQEKATKRMHLSHILLSFPLDMRGCCPAKTYEYMASGRPILVSPGGHYRDEIAKVLAETDGGVILSTPEKVAAWLSEKFSEFTITGTVTSNTDLSRVEKYSRLNQVYKLSQILNEAIQRQTPCT